jgi:hypothetical protein
MVKISSIIISIYALLMIATTACTGKGDQSRTTSLAEETPIKVSFQYSPQQPKAMEKVELTVFITQENERVQDADGVKYELWKDGQDQHELITASKTKDGSYSSLYTFSKPGKYYVIFHVDARGFHNMKKNELIILP